jgi:hypothetical protein
MFEENKKRLPGRRDVLKVHMGIITFVKSDHKEKHAEFLLIGASCKQPSVSFPGADVAALPSLKTVARSPR